MAGATLAVASRIRIPVVPDVQREAMRQAVGLVRVAVLAFIMGGLREVGEPCRKALIVDLTAPPAVASRFF